MQEDKRIEMQHPREKIINRRKSPIAVIMAQHRTVSESCHDSCNPISLQLASTPLIRDRKCGSHTDDYAILLRQGRMCYIISQYQYSPFLTSQNFTSLTQEGLRNGVFTSNVSLPLSARKLNAKHVPLSARQQCQHLAKLVFSFDFASAHKGIPSREKHHG